MLPESQASGIRIFDVAPPPADTRVAYGGDANQFGDLRLPKPGKPPFPVLMFIHGGFWRARYDLTHAGHICAALAAAGLATWNLEYRRAGSPGGGWPGTLDDLRAGFDFIRKLAPRYRLDPERIIVAGHSAGGHLALALAGHHPAVRRAASLAGVLDLQRAWELHLSNDAAAGFLGGTPRQVPEHYADADPMRLPITGQQLVVHGDADDVVPPDFSRRYAALKQSRGEDARLLMLPGAGHFDVVDPESKAWPKVQQAVMGMVAR